MDKFLLPDNISEENRLYQPSMTLNHLLPQAVMSGLPTVLIGMPEVLLRMKIASSLSLVELERIFNKLANHLLSKRTQETQLSELAEELYPEVFLEPKQEYMARMLA